MKKLIVIILTAGLLISITACGNSSAPESKSETASAAETQTTVSTPAADEEETAEASMTPAAAAEAEKTEASMTSAPVKEEPEETAEPESSSEEEKEIEKESDAETEEDEIKDQEDPETEEASAEEQESAASDPAEAGGSTPEEYPDVTVVSDDEIILGPNNEYMIISNIDFSECEWSDRYFTGTVYYTVYSKQAYVDNFSEYLDRKVVFGLYDAEGNLRGEEYTQDNFVYDREYTMDDWIYVMTATNAEIVDVRVEKIIIKKIKDS